MVLIRTFLYMRITVLCSDLSLSTHGLLYPALQETHPPHASALFNIGREKAFTFPGSLDSAYER